MGFSFVAKKLKRLAELGVKFICVIAHDRKAAALGGAIFGKGGNDYQPAGLYRPEYLAHIGSAFFFGS